MKFPTNIITNAVIAEFIGTLLFLYAIIEYNNPFVACIALLATLLTAGTVSKGHFNPAISVMSFYKGDLSSKELATYIVAQILGGIAALEIHKF
tara:strand:+ start:1906 stop:2187 length:282 start_codon:yes stop_codon:yes gene_type:complete